MATKKNKSKSEDEYLENINKPLYTLDHEQLREILDTKWYPKANNALAEQRKIWDYSYLAYKGIMLWSEINRTRRANQFGMYVNVPRTFMTIEGIRRNFNISKLKVQLEQASEMEDFKRNNLSSFLNYDIRRGGTFDQIKDAGFYKLLYGNGFLYSYLSERKGKFGKITGGVDEKTAVVKNTLDTKEKVKYFGMVARALSPYKIFPDPDGVTFDYNDAVNSPCNFTCIREVKHITTFRRDWAGIIPDKILDEVEPGGKDMTNYEAVKDTVDTLFSMDAMRYPGTVEDVIGTSKITKEYDAKEYVEERVWLGEDFLIVQAGKGLKFCLISPNPNPKKISNIVKLDDVKIPGEFWAMGEPYIMRYQQVEENRLHNYALDTIHFSMSGMIGINTQYLEDEYDLDVYPQKVWKMKAMPGVKIDEIMQTFQPSSNGVAPALKFMEEVKRISQSTTSITDFVTGASKSIAGTATEANKLSGASDLAIADKIKEMAGGALSKIAKIFLSMYPVAYADEKMSAVFEKHKIYFAGKDIKKITEKEIAKIISGKNPKEVIFLNDLDIDTPEFNVIGDISMNRGEKLSQWISVIDYMNKVNETAYATGDTRRLDVMKAGLRGMENFDVVGEPEEFLMEDQPTKMDEITLTGKVNGANRAAQGEGGGAPKKNKITKSQSDTSRMKQTAQPKNRGKNQGSKKNQ